MGSNIPSFNFAQFVLPVSEPEQLASGGAGGDGGSAESRPVGLAYGGGGAGGGSDAHGGSSVGGNTEGLAYGGDGSGTGGSGSDLFDLLGGHGAGAGLGGSALDAALGGSPLAGDGGLSSGGTGGAGSSSSVASSATAGSGAAGGAGGANSANQTVTPTNDLDFTDSFKTEDNDGLDFKHAHVEDSFNTHSGGVDNTHGVMSRSLVSGGDISDSGNSLDVTNFDHSFTDDHRALYDNVGNHTFDLGYDNVGNDSSGHFDDNGNTLTSTNVGHDVALGNTFDPNLLDIDVPSINVDLGGLIP